MNKKQLICLWVGIGVFLFLNLIHRGALSVRTDPKAPISDNQIWYFPWSPFELHSVAMYFIVIAPVVFAAIITFREKK
jgi:hypothetical protein